MKVTSLTRVTQPQAVKRRSVLTNVVLGDRLTEDRGRTNPGPSGAGAPQAHSRTDGRFGPWFRIAVIARARLARTRRKVRKVRRSGIFQ